MKVKAEIIEFSLLLTQEDPQIQNLVLGFFWEINHKSPDMINNTFPEIVQLLSRQESDGGVSEMKFEKIAIIILGLLDKEKSQESLVERLIQIIRDTEDSTTIRNSLLCVN